MSASFASFTSDSFSFLARSHLRRHEVVCRHRAFFGLLIVDGVGVAAAHLRIGASQMLEMVGLHHIVQPPFAF